MAQDESCWIGFAGRYLCLLVASVAPPWPTIFHVISSNFSDYRDSCERYLIRSPLKLADAGILGKDGFHKLTLGKNYTFQFFSQIFARARERVSLRINVSIEKVKF